jgi:hypothetical protein
MWRCTQSVLHFERQEVIFYYRTQKKVPTPVAMWFKTYGILNFAGSNPDAAFCGGPAPHPESIALPWLQPGNASSDLLLS